MLTSSGRKTTHPPGAFTPLLVGILLFAAGERSGRYPSSQLDGSAFWRKSGPDAHG